LLTTLFAWVCTTIAAQSLIDLGFTNIDNLDGRITAWTAFGRQLVGLNRQ
jgi:rhodanese-related sulfurtransferase